MGWRGARHRASGTFQRRPRKKGTLAQRTIGEEQEETTLLPQPHTRRVIIKMQMATDDTRGSFFTHTFAVCPLDSTEEDDVEVTS